MEARFKAYCWKGKDGLWLWTAVRTQEELEHPFTDEVLYAVELEIREVGEISEKTSGAAGGHA